MKYEITAIFITFLGLAAAVPAAVINKATDAAATTGGATGNNVQAYTGDLGGSPPPVIETPGNDRPFSVEGNTFDGKAAATQRSCAIQHNACANAANAAPNGQGGFTASDCGLQESECNRVNEVAQQPPAAN